MRNHGGSSHHDSMTYVDMADDVLGFLADKVGSPFCTPYILGWGGLQRVLCIVWGSQWTFPLHFRSHVTSVTAVYFF